MKLLIREYLASLREREELDAILPDLLSELGFNVYSRPRRGTTQHGVDIAAVGPGANGEQKLYLFSVKRGDLTRQDWDGSPQALRASLNEILDVYIPNHVPPEHANLKIVVCLCFGGDIHEQVRPAVTGFTSRHTDDRLSFEEWNGDKLAGLLLDGVLREELLPKQMRSSFQKAVALLDEPDIAYRHFAQLLQQMRGVDLDDVKVRVRTARQIYVCVWIMFVWARDIDNVEAPYKASELAILNVWELGKPLIGGSGRGKTELLEVFAQLVSLHLSIAMDFLDKKIKPHSKVRDALAMAVQSQSSLDVNLRLFDVLGRVATTGLWLHHISQRQEPEDRLSTEDMISQQCEIGLSMIESNGALWLPVADEQATTICSFLMLCLTSKVNWDDRVVAWLERIVSRYEFTVLAQQRYPTSFKDYRDLAGHPRERSDAYFKNATVGSTLIPILVAWTTAFGRLDLATKLADMVSEKLGHCCMQLWRPDKESEQHLYCNSDIHGRAIADLPIKTAGEELLPTILEACGRDSDFDELSAVRTGFWPVVLAACHHWKLPVPPDFWIHSLNPQENGTTSS